MMNSTKMRMKLTQLCCMLVSMGLSGYGSAAALESVSASKIMPTLSGNYKNDQKKVMLDPKQLISNIFVNFAYPKPTVITQPFVGNLLNFKVIFPPNSHWSPNRGFAGTTSYIENNKVFGYLTILGAQIIKNKHTVSQLARKHKRIPTDAKGNSNDIVNLLAYQTANKKIVYIDRNGQYAVIGGNIVGCLPQGCPLNNNIVTIQFASEVYKANLPKSVLGNQGQFPANFSMSAVKALPSILDGKASAPKTMYVVTDPNCPPCHALYQSMRPYVQNGQVSIHWIGIGILEPTSIGKTWAIYSGQVPPGSGYPATPIGALKYDEDFVDVGGIPPSNNPSALAINAVSKSQLGMLSLGNLSFPTIMYTNTEGKTTVQIGTGNAALTIADIKSK